MKKVTISKDARKAIQSAGEQAAFAASFYAYYNGGLLDYHIHINKVRLIMVEAEPDGGWTLASYQDAFNHAINAYRKHMKRHNIHVLSDMGEAYDDISQELALEKRARHIDRRYSERVYFFTRFEAECKDNDQRHHDLVVRDIKAIIREMAAAEVKLETELSLEKARAVVESAIKRAHGYTGKFLGREYMEYLDRFTASEYDEFLSIARAEFEKATKNAPADQSESTAD